jgi:hypothetical protein
MAENGAKAHRLKLFFPFFFSYLSPTLILSINTLIITHFQKAVKRGRNLEFAESINNIM